MSAEGITVPPIVATFLRWTWMRAMLHRGYWLVASLYLVVDARLSPAQLVLIGSAQGVVSLVTEVPTGVMEPVHDGCPPCTDERGVSGV